jgi:hypothetical protein
VPPGNFLFNVAHLAFSAVGPQPIRGAIREDLATAHASHLPRSSACQEDGSSCIQKTQNPEQGFLAGHADPGSLRRPGGEDDLLVAGRVPGHADPGNPWRFSDFQLP